MSELSDKIRGRAELLAYDTVRNTIGLRGRVEPGDRAIPSFVIIGAQRSGTTSLFKYLRQHPSVRMPVRKEVHYFDQDFGRGVDWYLSHFPTVKSMVGGEITGEATPYYLFHPLAARRAASVLPDARLIAMLRDPVERARSHYAHERAKGYETLDLEAALEAEPGRVEPEHQKMLEDPSYQSWDHQNYSYVSRGRYLKQLLEWEKYFPREQMLVLASEELFADPQGVIDRVTGFLGLPPVTLFDVKPHNSYDRNRTLDATAQRLVQMFADDNRALYDHLGRDLGWLRPG